MECELNRNTVYSILGRYAEIKTKKYLFPMAKLC